MGDAFSVAGSAVGVISLGLSVCQGLNTYYGQYKSFHKDIQLATSHIDNLNCILESLMKTIRQSELQNASFTAEPARIALDTIDQCNQKLKELEAMLQKCKGTPVTATTTLKISKSRALYPFRRETLLALRESVSWLQDNLGNSLNLLNLALTLTDHVQLASIASISVSTHQSVETIGERMDQMESNLNLISPQYLQQPAVLQSLLEKTERLEQYMKTLTLQPDNYLRRPVIEQEFPSKASSRTSRGFQPESTRRTSRSTGKEHLHDSKNNSLTLFRRLSFMKGFVDVAVQVSLKIKIGAGGSSILRNPMYHATVAYDSPAFALISLYDGRKTSLEELHHDLFDLFQLGKASPLDRLASGKTLLHALCLSSVRFSHMKQAVAECWLHESNIFSWRALMRSLILAGTSPDEPDSQGTCPGHILLLRISNFLLYDARERWAACQQELIKTCLEYLDSGGVLRIHNPTSSSIDTPAYYPFSLLQSRGQEILSQIACRAEFCDMTDFDVPEPLIPLVLRSRAKLERLLKRGVDFRAELDLYTVWPEGLSTLLQAGYKADIKTMRMALEIGSCVVLTILRDTGNLHPELCIPSLWTCPNPDARKIVIQELAERRKTLLGLAMTHLPTKTILQLRLRPEILLGYQAAQVHSILENESIDTGDTVFTHGWLVYQAADFNIELADQFWDVGFRDVNDMDEEGMTALMKFESPSIPHPPKLLRMASWLIGKGADTGLCPIMYDFSALHFLGAALGWSICVWNYLISQLPSDCEAVIHLIFLGNSHDSCYCHCSPGGCTPLVAFLHRFIGTDQDLYYIEEYAIPFISGVFESLNSKCTEILRSKVVSEVLRFITFRALGITHTCAHPEYSPLGELEFKPFDPEEAREIHEEERESIREMECLVREFNSDYQRLSLPFETFLREHWYARMHEVFAKKEPLSEEVKSQIRGIGVVLLESESEGED